MAINAGYISLFNYSNGRMSDPDVQAAADALNQQFYNEYWWYWGNAPYVDVNGYGMPIIIEEYPGANDPYTLGFHWLTSSNYPYAVVFAGLSEDNGVAPSGVISHEAVEMESDPMVDTFDVLDFGDDDGDGFSTGLLIFRETADPVEAQSYYESNGVIVSNFATPDWYSPVGQWPYDALGILNAPLTLLSGGYVSYRYAEMYPWQQAFARQAEGIERAKAARLQTIRTANIDSRQDVIAELQQNGAASKVGRQQRQPSQTGQLRADIQGRRQPQRAGRTQQDQQPEETAQAGRRPVSTGLPNGDRIQVVSEQDLPDVLRQVRQEAASATSSGGQAGRQVPDRVRQAQESARDRTGAPTRTQTQQGRARQAQRVAPAQATPTGPKAKQNANA